MDEATAKNLSNYICLFDANANESFAAINDVKVKEFAADGKSITFYYPGAGDLVAGNTFRVLAIKDLAGNMIASTVVDRNTSTGLTLADGSNVKAVATDKIEVYFNSEIKTADPSAFKVQKTGVDFSTFSAYEIKNDSGTSTYKVIFTLVNPLESTDTTDYTLVTNVSNVISNIYGSKFFGTVSTIVDDIAPSIKEVAAKDGEKIQIDFTEVVEAVDLDAVFGSLILVDPDGNVISATGAKLTDVTFSKAGVAVDEAEIYTTGFDSITLQFAADQAGKVYKVSFLSRAGSIEDNVGKVIKAFAETSVTLKD